MSGSYFVRHTEGIAVRKEDLRRLWAEDRIAVHFPEETPRNEQDSESLIPADYVPPNAKGAIAAFADWPRRADTSGRKATCRTAPRLATSEVGERVDKAR